MPRRPSYASFTSTLALVIAVAGGTAYAAPMFVQGSASISYYETTVTQTSIEGLGIPSDLPPFATIPGVGDLAPYARAGPSNAWIELRLGLSWRTYLLHARMLRAMALLASPGQTVQETSTAVGFDSLSSFTRAFTQFSGETPSTYRAA